MKLILKRIAKKKTYTIGHLYVSNESSDTPPSSASSACNEFICDTLEPTWRDYAHGQRKIKGRSAIPEGRYAVVISWSPKFKQWLPILLGGPDFNRQWQGIRIHAGNTTHDTEGCILVGENRRVGELLDSRICLQRVKQLIVEAKDRDEAVYLTVV